jgi:hypothetical protein
VAPNNMTPTAPGEVPPSLRRPTPQMGVGATTDVTSLQKKYGLQPVGIDSSDPKVWLGDEQSKLDPSKWPSLSQVSTAYGNLSPQSSKKLFSTLDKYYGKGRWNVSYIKNFWLEGAQISASELLKGNKVSVLDAFDKIIEQAAAAGVDLGGGGKGPDITKSISLTDPQTAETLIDQALQQYLGRKASVAEVEDFRKSLTRAEKRAPVEVDVVGGDTSVRSGGFNPAVFAQQYAEGMEGAAEYQAATTFLDAFIGAIGPRVEL